MSCAVMMLHPYVSSEIHPMSDMKAESSASSHSSISSVSSGSVSPTHPTAIHPSHHGQRQMEQQPSLAEIRHRSHVTGSSKESKPSTPCDEEHTTEKGYQKPCPTSSQSYAPSLNNQSPHQDLKHSPPSLVSSAPTIPQLNERDVKYVSANCIVVTHYRGDTSAVVDEHFSRALAIKSFKAGDSHLRVASKNFPPSFYQPQNTHRPSMGMAGSLGGGHTPSELYEAYHGGLHSIQAPGNDPWGYAFSPQSYAHRSVGHDIYHSAMTSASHPYQYSSLGFQQPFSRIPTVPVSSQINKGDGWGSRYYETFVGASDLTNGMDTAPYSPAHYHNVTGIEAGMAQECAKDLYWL